MSEKYDILSDETLALMYGELARAISTVHDDVEDSFEFRAPRTVLVHEIERMREWIQAHPHLDYGIETSKESAGIVLEICRHTAG